MSTLASSPGTKEAVLATCWQISVPGHGSYRPMHRRFTLKVHYKLGLLLHDLQLMDSGNIPPDPWSPFPSIKHWFQKDSSITALNSQAYGRVSSLECFLASSLLHNFSSCHLSLILSSCALIYIGVQKVLSGSTCLSKLSKVVVSPSLTLSKIKDDSLITLSTDLPQIKDEETPAHFFSLYSGQDGGQ